MSLGRFEDSLLLLKRLEQKCIQKNMIGLLCSTYSAMGEAYRQLGNKSSAIELFSKSVEACKEVLRQPDSTESVLIRQNLRGALGNLADLTKDTGDLDSALPIYEEMELVARSLNEIHWIQASLNNQGYIYLKFKKYGLALKALEKQGIICRQERMKDDLARSLYFQALIHDKKGNIKRFRKLFKDIEKLAEENDKYQTLLDELRRLRP